MQSPLPTGSKGKLSASSGTLAFVKQLATYYMDFLETDFHRRRNPKRTIRFRNSDNLLVGVSLARYPSFLQQIPKLLQAAFDKNVVSHIAKASYRTTIPTALLKLIDLELENISETQFAGIQTTVGGEIEQLARANRGDYDKALTLSLEVAAKHVRAELIFPLVSHLQKPLENAGLGDENTRFMMEEELCELLIEPARNKISELVRKLVTGHPTDARSELEPVFTLSACRQRIEEFFSNFALGDLFSELYELDRNRTILEKQELYLYFGDITHNGVKYPLFYIPLQASTGRDDIGIEFDARLYVNKRALDFIVQEENDRTGKKGTLKSTAQRIIYLAQHEHSLVDAVSAVFSELSNFFGLDRAVDVRNPAAQLAKSASVRVTNAAYFGLFDSSDEALVNDYEQLLQLLAEAGPESAIAGAFSGLIDDFIHRNPESVTREVEEQWDSLSMPDRLVSESPIPLNSEQRQILLALKKDRCHYSTVEGPPGTGKSHTITAIVCDAVLSHRTVLVLSDKTEALDVVEDKITETLNRVRGDRQFQNPILRLGKTGSTYAQILSTAVMDGIKTHYRAVKKEHDSLEQTIQQRVSSVKEDLEAEALAYAEVELPEIREWAELEGYYTSAGQLVDCEELLQSEDGITDLEELRNVCVKVQQLLADPTVNEIQSALGFKDLTDADQMSGLAAAADELDSVLTKLTQQYPNAESDLGMLGQLSAEAIPDLTTFVSEFAALKQLIVGFLFTKRKAESLDLQFRKRFAFAASRPPHAHLAVLRRILDTVTVLNAQAQATSQPELRLSLCQRLLTQPLQRAVLRTLSELSAGIQTVTSAIQRYPRSAKSLRIRRSSCGSIATNRLTSLRDEEFSFLMRYLALTDQLVHKFQAIAETNYGEEIRRVQDLVAVHMTYIMDGQVIDFYENHRNTAKALRDVIRSKQQFPKEEFGKLREAFPCILAGIRDYAEFIPLEPELFDLLIIDEASQVSIAQALPALLRAKQILILGDKKQFSNIKAAQARSDTNREHLNRLEASFRENVSQEPSKLVKLERFNIRTSVLEFFEFISNYHTQLLKHFRGYKELISYSNVNFYRRSLQAMKIRAKPIDEVIRFTQLQSTQAPGPRNINQTEVDFIMGELAKLKAGTRTASIGIITPHTDQQKLLVDTVGRSPDREYFYNDLNLKIMTFDTCQGEERDSIYYSMVANANNDRLWGVFIKNLASIDLEEDGQIKAQRLNVGFSRAKECVHFVISKPLEAFNGAVGEALRHFWAAREVARKERTAADVDQKSAREAEVLNWFYQTEFWKAERERVEFIPQFEIGKYLKQLDPRYTHPLYRVDFLLTYRPNADLEQKIVIEYDGFKEHFGAASGVDATNYGAYYSEEDVFRQKVLESYGYRFLRVNRFNAGNDPIATLNTRIRLLLVSQPTMKGDSVLQSLHHTITQLKNGELKECPKCKEVRELKEFRDPKLASGVGRFCATCKSSKPAVRRGRARPPPRKSPAPSRARHADHE